MKTIKKILTNVVINGNNSYNIEKDTEITEDILKAMKEYGKIQYENGYKDTTSEAISEIRRNYNPNKIL